LLRVKARGAAIDVDESEYLIRVSRVSDGGMATFDVTEEYMLLPGDVVDVKLKRPPSESERSFSTEAIRDLDPASSVAEAKDQATSQ
jgi:hypothetical protein